MNNRILKQHSKELMMTAKPSPITVALLFVTIVLILDSLSARVMSQNITNTAMMKYQALLEKGDFDAIANMAPEIMPDAKQTIIDSIIQFVLEIIGFGFTIFTLNVVNNSDEACIGNLLDGFGYVLKIIIFGLLEFIVVFTASLLLVFPGIIMAYSYRQTKYLIIEHPELSVPKCMSVSRKMMKGHKWELFKLDLSFLGWILLSAITPTRIWSEPYMGIAYALYYKELSSPQAEMEML